MQKPKEMNVKSQQAPVGTIYVVDPSPLNWLYVLYNTIEEAIRADHRGQIIPSLATKADWKDETTLELRLRKGVLYHNNEIFTSKNVRTHFDHLMRWFAPHPPGTWLNIPEETTLELIGDYTVRYHFPKPEGLALGKFRAHHWTNLLFWDKLGFGYATVGSAEGSVRCHCLLQLLEAIPFRFILSYLCPY